MGAVEAKVMVFYDNVEKGWNGFMITKGIIYFSAKSIRTQPLGHVVRHIESVHLHDALSKLRCGSAGNRREVVL